MTFPAQATSTALYCMASARKMVAKKRRCRERRVRSPGIIQTNGGSS
jgi:hypothetical protein